MIGKKQCWLATNQVEPVPTCLHDTQDQKGRGGNQFLSVPFRDGTIGAYGPVVERYG